MSVQCLVKNEFHRNINYINYKGKKIKIKEKQKKEQKRNRKKLRRQSFNNINLREKLRKGKENKQGGKTHTNKQNNFLGGKKGKKIRKQRQEFIKQNDTKKDTHTQKKFRISRKK